MDVDGMDAFNRLLERVEELSGACTRADADSAKLRAALIEHEHTIGVLKRENSAVGRFERFVESTPERQADWISFLNPPKLSGDDSAF